MHCILTQEEQCIDNALLICRFVVFDFQCIAIPWITRLSIPQDWISDCFVISMHCKFCRKLQCIDIRLQCKYLSHIVGHVNLNLLSIALRLVLADTSSRDVHCCLVYVHCHLVYVHCFYVHCFTITIHCFYPLRRGHNLLSNDITLIAYMHWYS